MSSNTLSKPMVRRAASSATDLPQTWTSDIDAYVEPGGRLRKSFSMDSRDADSLSKLVSSGSFRRRAVRRRGNKRIGRPEPEYGQDTEAYEKIRERVFQERAVTNAIDALQERWRMIMYMYGDLVDLNEERKARKLKKLCVKRQYELSLFFAALVLLCVPLSIMFVLLTG